MLPLKPVGEDFLASPSFRWFACNHYLVDALFQLLVFAWRSPCVSSHHHLSVYICLCPHFPLPLLVRTFICWTRAYMNNFIFIWLSLWRPHLQIKSHSEVLGIRLQHISLGDIIQPITAMKSLKHTHSHTQHLHWIFKTRRKTMSMIDRGRTSKVRSNMLIEYYPGVRVVSPLVLWGITIYSPFHLTWGNRGMKELLKVTQLLRDKSGSQINFYVNQEPKR